MDERKMYFLSDGGEVANARMMTLDEARKAQDEADAATGGDWIWSGPFDVSGPYAKEPWKISSAK